METTKGLIVKTTIVATLVMLVDQVMKLIVRQTLGVCSAPPFTACERIDLGGPFGLVPVENAGSALGFMQGLWIWALIAALGLALLPLYGRRLARIGWPAALAIGLQAGGALGNLLDRAAHGGATDFIDVGVGIVFNPADVALLAGMLLAFEALRRSGREPAGVEKPGSPAAMARAQRPVYTGRHDASGA